jgi:hypothetical protein
MEKVNAGLKLNAVQLIYFLVAAQSFFAKKLYLRIING